MSSTDAASVRIARPLLPQHFSRTFPSLENRNFRLLLSGLLVSGTGGWIQRIAQDWLVLTLTDSPTAVGVVTACQFVPTLLFGLHAGLLFDARGEEHWPQFLQLVLVVIATGPGSELRRPLGITIIGGLLVSQVLTLYTTPVIYLLIDRLRSRGRRAPLAVPAE